MYYKGIGIEKNYKLAFKFYKISAKRGNHLALYSLGNMYFNGIGVEKNIKKSYKWFKLSAEKGNSISQENINIIEKLNY